MTCNRGVVGFPETFFVWPSAIVELRPVSAGRQESDVDMYVRACLARCKIAYSDQLCRHCGTIRMHTWGLCSVALWQRHRGRAACSVCIGSVLTDA